MHKTLRKSENFKIVVCASGGGGNFQSIIDTSYELGIDISLLIVDRSCNAISRAITHSIPYIKLNTSNGREEMFTEFEKSIPKDIDLIVVDYLQLADAGKRFESRVQEVSFVSQGLKNLARELKVPVLALSQLSRAVEQRGTKKPQLADLRESGAIEQDADVVMFLYYEDESEDLLNASKRMVKLYMAKHRNGSTGEMDLMFRGDRVKFYSIDKSTISV